MCVCVCVCVCAGVCFDSAWRAAEGVEGIQGVGEGAKFDAKHVSVTLGDLFRGLSVTIPAASLPSSVPLC